MTTRFIAADHPAGRILLRSGAVDVGAVSPQGLPRDRLPWTGAHGTKCRGKNDH